nr:FCD domain-containing protein [uncultured Oscillibacter sp.]
MGLKSTKEEYAGISQEEHRKIWEAMEKKDADAARKEMEKHIYRSLEDVLTRY